MNKFTVIFDIDGVIVDSEQLHFDALLKVVYDNAKDFTPEQLIGLSLEATLETIGVPKAQHADVSEKLTQAYKQMLNTQYLRPNIQQFIDDLDQSHIAYGFVSTAPRDVCLANLSLLKLKAQPKLISGTDIARTKPYPDPYIEMLKQLHADPHHTIVIEDTDLGISAAKGANIEYVYGWPHALSQQQNYKMATEVIQKLDDITLLSSLN